MKVSSAAIEPRVSSSIARPVLDRFGKTTIAVLILLGFMALAGGVALVARPDGSVMQMPARYLAGSPFPDFFIPGLILGGVFGIGSFAVAGLGLARMHVAPFLAFAIGCGQMIWICVELAIIKELSFLHPLCFGIGLAIAISSVRWGWPTFRDWRASRS